MIELDFLEELERFNLALKRHSVEQQEGEQTSSSVGHGMIFEDHKKYVPGDDIRRMDWKAYARTEEHFIKRFEEEKSVTLHILVDRSSSMDYGEFNKYDYAGKIGLALAHMATNTNDRYRFSVFSETVTDVSSARRDPNLGGLVDILNELPKTPESLIGRCLSEYGGRIKNRSIVVVISDFLMDLEQIREGVSRLQATDAVLVHVLDVNEVDPNFTGDFILQDAESDAELRTYVSGKMRQEYQQNLREHMDAIQDIAYENGAEYLAVSTGADVFDSFLRVWRTINKT
jgi:uncharacterized protein (DUF58 family)